MVFTVVPDIEINYFASAMLTGTSKFSGHESQAYLSQRDPIFMNFTKDRCESGPECSLMINAKVWPCVRIILSILPNLHSFPSMENPDCSLSKICILPGAVYTLWLSVWAPPMPQRRHCS